MINYVRLKFVCCFFILLSFNKFTGCLAGCPDDMVMCNATEVCLPAKYLCDGDADCQDAEDEKNCSARLSGCGGPFELHGSTGSFTSMNYPRAYENHVTCHWHIIAPPGSYVTLAFVDVFDVEKARHGECVYDGVSVYGKTASSFRWPVLFGRYCGNVPPAPIKTDGNEVFVEFQTDKQLVGRGFRIEWTTRNNKTNDRMTTTSETVSTSAASSLIKETGANGRVFSPGFETGRPYPSPYHCIWEIKVQSHYRIALHFSYLNMGMFSHGSCQGAWIKLFDGPDTTYPLIDQFCDATSPSELLSTSNIVTLEFWSEENPQALKGFNMSWSQIKPQIDSTTSLPLMPGCDGIPMNLQSVEGILTSPYFNAKGTYPNNLDCEAHLNGPSGTVFRFHFVKFDIEQSRNCTFDSLTFYDNLNNNISVNDTGINDASIIENICGLSLPYDVITKSNQVVVRFHTDNQVAGVGFNMSYETIAPPPQCSEDEFQCGSQECVPLSEVCDGISQCNDSTDEAACPLSQACGVPAIKPSLMASRIVGGEEAVDGSWPWTLSVLKDSKHQCGATLILPGWALSAAHCFAFVYDRNYSSYTVIAGRHKLNVPSRQEQVRPVIDVIIPGDYDSQTSFHDIALIKLHTAFTVSPFVSSACLPDHPAPTGETCYIAGWGETLTSCCKDVLKQAAVPVMNASLCARPDFYGSRIRDGMMCAGLAEGGVDACGGDSGGPLSCRRSTGVWEVQGVTSWGQFCGLAKQPGVYTRVSDFLPWIQQTIALYQG